MRITRILFLTGISLVALAPRIRTQQADLLESASMISSSPSKSPPTTTLELINNLWPAESDHWKGSDSSKVKTLQPPTSVDPANRLDRQQIVPANSSSPSPDLAASNEALELSAFQAAQYDYFRHSASVSVILTIAYTMVFVVGIVGNSFVVAIVCKAPRMRTVTNYFIANLALADILVLFLCLPATLVGNLFIPYVLGLFVCKTVSYLQGVAVSASINTMVAVTMDRFLAICFPMDWHMSRRTVRWTIACIWLFSLSISLPWALYFTLVPYQLDHRTIQVCAEDWPSERIGNIYFVCANLILLYLFPAAIIIFCYLGIWYKIERRNIPGDRPKGLKIELIMQKSKLKVVKMMMVVVVIFLLSWLPLYLIFARIKLAEERGPWEEWLITKMMPLAQWLGASNSCINPILYTFFNRKYKRGFIDLLRFGFCCKPALPDANQSNGNMSAKYGAKVNGRANTTASHGRQIQMQSMQKGWPIGCDAGAQLVKNGHRNKATNNQEDNYCIRKSRPPPNPLRRISIGAIGSGASSGHTFARSWLRRSSNNISSPSGTSTTNSNNMNNNNSADSRARLKFAHEFSLSSGRKLSGSEEQVLCHHRHGHLHHKRHGQRQQKPTRTANAGGLLLTSERLNNGNIVEPTDKQYGDRVTKKRQKAKRKQRSNSRSTGDRSLKSNSTNTTDITALSSTNGTGANQDLRTSVVSLALPSVSPATASAAKIDANVDAKETGAVMEFVAGGGGRFEDLYKSNKIADFACRQPIEVSTGLDQLHKTSSKISGRSTSGGDQSACSISCSCQNGHASFEQEEDESDYGRESNDDNDNDDQDDNDDDNEEDNDHCGQIEEAAVNEDNVIMNNEGDNLLSGSDYNDFDKQHTGHRSFEVDSLCIASNSLRPTGSIPANTIPIPEVDSRATQRNSLLCKDDNQQIDFIDAIKIDDVHHSIDIETRSIGINYNAHNVNDSRHYVRKPSSDAHNIRGRRHWLSKSKLKSNPELDVQI